MVLRDTHSYLGYRANKVLEIGAQIRVEVGKEIGL